MAEQVLVTGVLGCLGAWVATLRRSRTATSSSASTSATTRSRLELVLGATRAGRARPGRHRRPRRAGDRPRRARDHPRRPPRRAAGAVRPRQPAARDAGQRRGHGQRLRRSLAAARADPQRHVRELGRRLHRRRPLPRARVRRHRARARSTASRSSPTRAWRGSTAPSSGVPSIGLRPYVVYGPGRDQGMTSGPSVAMLAAARGEPFHIGYSRRCAIRLRPRRGAGARDGGAFRARAGAPSTTCPARSPTSARWSPASARPRRAPGSRGTARRCRSRRRSRRSASTATSARSRGRSSPYGVAATVAHFRRTLV